MRREFRTTLIELIDIATPAIIGFKSILKEYRAPKATGIANML